jgi:hypothetical protein
MVLDSEVPSKFAQRLLLTHVTRYHVDIHCRSGSQLAVVGAAEGLKVQPERTRIVIQLDFLKVCV